MNETRFAKKRKMNFYARRQIKKGIIRILGEEYSLAKVQEVYEMLHMPWKTLLLYGPPGGGKTHLVRKVIPVLMQKILELKVSAYYSNLGDFTNNVSDFKYFPVLENNNLSYKKSELVSLNEKALTEDFVVLNIFDEVSRLTNAAQNLLLPLTEDNDTRSFILGHMGESIRIKQHSAIVLLMNPDGNGTMDVNEALLDRTAAIHIPAPTTADLAMIFNSKKANEEAGYDLDALLPLEPRTLTDDQKEMVIEFFNIYKLSIRQFKEIFWLLENSPFPARRLADLIRNRVDLNIIQPNHFSMYQLERTEIPELLYRLDREYELFNEPIF